jgi:hypothetical protein
MLAAGLVLAAAPAMGAVKGTFSYQGATFTPVDAVAYESTPEMGEGTAVRVALSAQKIDAAAVESALDYRHAVRLQRGDAKYVDLEFGTDGRWSGASYMLGGSTNCGWCGDSAAGAKSQVRVEGGRLKGTLRVRPADYVDRDGPAVDLTLDLPILRQAAGTALAADGGEAGRSLAACRQAVLKKDAAAARKACFAADDPRLALLAETSEEGFWMAGFYDRESLKLPSLKVTGGRTKGEWAELRVEGKDESGQARKGSVYLRRGAAGWRYDHDELGYVF